MIINNTNESLCNRTLFNLYYSKKIIRYSFRMLSSTVSHMTPAKTSTCEGCCFIELNFV